MIELVARVSECFIIPATKVTSFVKFPKRMLEFIDMCQMYFWHMKELNTLDAKSVAIKDDNLSWQKIVNTRRLEDTAIIEMKSKPRTIAKLFSSNFANELTKGTYLFPKSSSSMNLSGSTST